MHNVYLTFGDEGDGSVHVCVCVCVAPTDEEKAWE